MSNVTIIGKGPKSQGTKVLVDGVAMKGVRKIEIVIEGGEMIRAVIHVVPAAIDVTDLDAKEMQCVSSQKERYLEHDVLKYWHRALGHLLKPARNFRATK